MEWFAENWPTLMAVAALIGMSLLNHWIGVISDRRNPPTDDEIKRREAQRERQIRYGEM